MAERTYPADPANAALRLFSQWLGRHYARSTRLEECLSDGGVARGTLQVGRRWDLAFSVIDTTAPEATMPWEAARAAIEQRLDAAGKSLALWAPRGARLPAEEPALSQLMVAVEQAAHLEDGRLEVRRPVNLWLRRISPEGSVVTILGGLSEHWAQFTNRVPGSFQLNSSELLRLPSSQEERDELAERIVLAAQQPEADESQTIQATDAWSASDLEEGGSCVIGTPVPENDETSSALRRNLRKLLREAEPTLHRDAAAKALVLLGAFTYADNEKLSWAIRGMDPALYAGYDLVAVVADGLVKPLLQPGRGALPWDA